jgi:hypothetical protein
MVREKLPERPESVPLFATVLRSFRNEFAHASRVDRSMRSVDVMTDIIRQAFDQALRENGFKKVGGSWYLDQDETVLVANLQKSSYSVKFYVNLAVWFKVLGAAHAPKERLCHLRQRLEGLADESIIGAYDGEISTISDADRVKLIRSSMEEIGIPFLLACRTLALAKKQVRARKLADAIVLKELKELMARPS